MHLQVKRHSRTHLYAYEWRDTPVPIYTLGSRLRHSSTHLYTWEWRGTPGKMSICLRVERHSRTHLYAYEKRDTRIMSIINHPYFLSKSNCYCWRHLNSPPASQYQKPLKLETLNQGHKDAVDKNNTSNPGIKKQPTYCKLSNQVIWHQQEAYNKS